MVVPLSWWPRLRVLVAIQSDRLLLDLGRDVLSKPRKDEFVDLVVIHSSTDAAHFDHVQHFGYRHRIRCVGQRLANRLRQTIEQFKMSLFGSDLLAGDIA